MHEVAQIRNEYVEGRFVVGVGCGRAVAQVGAHAGEVHRFEVSRCGDDEAGGHRQTGARQLAEICALTPGERHIVLRDVVEPSDAVVHGMAPCMARYAERRSR